ncbi:MULTISPECIES: AAA family ATPase [Tsukamurella]|uniref:AAA family ATPase n=1 Tax=Tsukamurella strandjordii TaxID=147577 RepID=A0AA90SHU1_9ACTN|nr:AAA family ATPase [Tsukamurella strandjordii]MDP0399219.1 AAA family ATPase [Tsukamurella strandjordii]
MPEGKNTPNDGAAGEPEDARYLSPTYLAHLVGKDAGATALELIEDTDARRELTTFAIRCGLALDAETWLGDLPAIPAVVAHHLGQQPTRADVARWSAETGEIDPHEIGAELEQAAERLSADKREQARARRELSRQSNGTVRLTTAFSFWTVAALDTPEAERAVAEFWRSNRLAWRSRGATKRYERYEVTASELRDCGVPVATIAEMPPMSGDDMDRAVREVALARETDRREQRREAERLEAEHAAADVAIPPRIDLATYEPSPTPWVVESLLAQGAVLGLFAERKAGKTTVVRELVRAAVDGEKFLGRFGVTLADGARVVVLDTEMPIDTLHREYSRAGVVSLDRLDLRSLRGAERSLDARTDAVRDRWRREIAPGSLIVVDCIYTLFGALGVSENSDEVVTVLAGLRSLATECEAAGMVLVHHLGKDADKGARGHSSLEGFPDAIARIELEGSLAPDTPRTFSALGRDGVAVDRGLLTLGDDHRLTLGVDPKHERIAAQRVGDDDAVLALIVAHPRSSLRSLTDLSKATNGLSRRRVQAALARLDNTRQIENQGTPKNAEWVATPGCDPFGSPLSLVPGNGSE